MPQRLRARSATSRTGAAAGDERGAGFSFQDRGPRMSQTLIGNYLSDLAQLRQVSGSRRESVLREAFKDLLKAWGRQHDLMFVPE